MRLNVSKLSFKVFYVAKMLNFEKISFGKFILLKFILYDLVLSYTFISIVLSYCTSLYFHLSVL